MKAKRTQIQSSTSQNGAAAAKWVRQADVEKQRREEYYAEQKKAEQERNQREQEKLERIR